MVIEQPTKRFHIGDLLSVVTDRLVSPSHMDGSDDDSPPRGAGMSDVRSGTAGVVWFTAAVERKCELGCNCAIEVGDRVAYVADDYAVVCLGACGERAEKEQP